MRRQIVFFITIISFGFLFLVNCGKVTQEVSKSEEKEQKTFDLLFNLEMVPTSDPRLDLNSKLHKEEKPLHKDNELLLEEGNTLYISVEGIKKNEGLTMLSWGKMILQKKDVETNVSTVSESVVTSDVKTLLESITTDNATATTNVTVTGNTAIMTKEAPIVIDDSQLESVAYSRHLLKITGAKYNDAYAKLLAPIKEHDLKKYKVDIKTIKLKYGFDGYVIKVFTDKDHYRFFSFDKETAVEHNSYSKGDMSLYETFLNTLYLMSLKENDYILEKTTSPTVEMYERLYPEEFFNLLEDYQLPENKTKKFKATMPRFTLDRKFEEELRMVMTHLLSTSKNDAKRYIDESKILKLSRVAKRLLESRIDAFILPEDLEAEDDPVKEDKDSKADKEEEGAVPSNVLDAKDDTNTKEETQKPEEKAEGKGPAS